MGLETPKPVIYPPLPPPAVEDPWAWYSNAEGDDNDDVEIEEESERRLCFSFFSFWSFMPKWEKKITIYLAILLFLGL
jgi:hypothetical protein